MEIVNLKNRNITVIPPSLIHEIGCFVRVSTRKKLIPFQIYLFFCIFENINKFHKLLNMYCIDNILINYITYLTKM